MAGPLKEYWADVQSPYKDPFPQIQLWQNKRNQWAPLAPSHRMGPEIAFGHAIAKALPNENIRLVKYAANGTALYNDWAPTSGPQYISFMAATQEALANLEANLVPYEISGILWMQGESDAYEGEAANYETNLTNFITHMRTALGTPQLPFIIARVRDHFGGTLPPIIGSQTDPTQADIVRTAQVSVADAMPYVTWFDTDTYAVVDPVTNPGHYGAKGQFDLGNDFAAAVLPLLRTAQSADKAQVLISPSASGETPRVTKLSAIVQSGQIFLTWDEELSPDGTTYEVFMHPTPITPGNLDEAQKIGHHVEAGSACDWWKDPASFDVNASSDRTHGFFINGKELDPQGGLFVHTVVDSDPKAMYLAVLPSTAKPSDVVAGVNSLNMPVTGAPSLPQPIPLKAAPTAGSGIGKSLTLALHGRGGGRDSDNKSNFLVFGDAHQGWREGLARKFIVSSDANGIVIEPRDWLWVGRPLLFSGDLRDHGLAINTWWYGCNDHIYDAEAVATGVVVNYTEAYLLYLVRWAQQYYGTDPQKTYIKGTSMGGSGAISVGFHHPDVFATIYSEVPVVAYTRRSSADGRSNLVRLNGLSGRVCDETVMSDEGISVMERMNSERIVREYAGDLPFLVLCNGRTDGSIPWVNNPSFYRALNEAKRGFAAYWNNGAHDMWKHVPTDVTDFYTTQAIALGDSYPAFSNFSDSRDAGDGERDDGDLIGWMNRGIYWADVVETENSWSLSLWADGDFLPASVTVDVTPRRLSQLQISPNETFLVNGNPVQADTNGRLTATGLQITKKTPMLLQIQRL